MPSHRIVANLVDDSLDEVTYSASLAGSRHSLGYHSEGISFRVYGYHDKLPLLLQIVLEKIKNLQPREDRLKVFKEKVRGSRPGDTSPTDKENIAGNPRLQEFFLAKAGGSRRLLRQVLHRCLHWTPEEKLVEVTGRTYG